MSALASVLMSISAIAVRGLKAARWGVPLALVLALALGFCVAPCSAQSGQIVNVQGPSRQVTLFAIQALPKDPTIDPKLRAIAPQLKRLLPNHGFKLIDVQSKRIGENEQILCRIDDSLGARAEMVRSLDGDGKVQFRFSLVTPVGLPIFSTIVSTPPNQIFFCDKVLPDGTRLLLGIGAR